MGDYCVTLTSVLSLLEVKRGLMVVPKPTMLSLVPGGRLFSAITMASCRHKAELMIRPDQRPRIRPRVSPSHSGSWCRSCFRCNPPETAALGWLCEGLKVRTAGWDRSSASGRGCSECPCGVASSQTPAAGGRQEHRRVRLGLVKVKEARVSTNLPFGLRIFSSAADEISAGGDLLFILAEGEPASL